MQKLKWEFQHYELEKKQIHKEFINFHKLIQMGVLNIWEDTFRKLLRAGQAHCLIRTNETINNVISENK